MSELVGFYGTGRREALAELLAEYRLALVGYLYNQIRDETMAEDLAHDVLASALAHLDELNPDRALWPWLLVIARNRLTDHHRRVGTARQLDEDPRVCETLGPSRPAGSMSDYDDPGIRIQEHQLLEAAMRALPARQRSALMLHDVHGWSADQVAELHDRNRNAVHQLLYRARARVRDEYQRLSGDRGPLVVLPWPLLWVGELARRAGSRTRRTIQEWHLALPALGESVTSIALVATLSLGAGAMWSTDPADAASDPADLPDLISPDLAASAQADAPHYASDHTPTTRHEQTKLDQTDERLTTAIQEAEPDAIEAQRAAQESVSDHDSGPDDPPAANPSLGSPEASVEPTVGTTESKHIDDGMRLEYGTHTRIEAGDVESESEGGGGVEWRCDSTATELACDTADPESDGPSAEEIAEDVEDTDADETATDMEDYASDREDDVEEMPELLVDYAENGACEPDDAIGTTCETAESVE